MNGFARNIDAALASRYGLVVVGGGIYGMMLTLEAARRGLKPLLVEKDDFGGATSLHSLRILHGGLRYLQHLDFRRVFESIEQRGWFLQHFGSLCRALPCLMPLYGKGLKRPGIFRPALALNNALSKHLPPGRILDVEETVERFPKVRREGLQGAALWYDGQVLSPQRLHAELLRWAVQCGATVLNYTEAVGLKREGSRVAGLVTNAGEFTAPVVINAAGPWCREVSARLDRDRPELMTPSLTFNVVLDVPPPSDAAVAVQGERMYFITPHRAGVTFAGTIHRVWEGASEPTGEMIWEFLEDLNRAIPDWGVKRSDVLRVTAGVLPCRGPGEADMAHRSTFVKHDIEGLFSICGIKYTTAQRFAVRTLERVFGAGQGDDSNPEIGDRADYSDTAAVMALEDDALSRLMAEEAVTCADDLLERRMDWIVDQQERVRFRTRVEGILHGQPAAMP